MNVRVMITTDMGIMEEEGDCGEYCRNISSCEDFCKGFIPKDKSIIDWVSEYDHEYLFDIKCPSMTGYDYGDGDDNDGEL